MNTLNFILNILALAAGNLCASQLAAVPIRKIPRELVRDFRCRGGLSLLVIVIVAYFVLVQGFGMAESPGKPLHVIGKYLAMGFLSNLVVIAGSRWFESREAANVGG